MSNVIEKTRENAPFLERYFANYKHDRVARGVGHLATAEAFALDRRFDVEVASGFSEALDGRVRTEYDFGIEHGKIIADDGESFESMMFRARRDAYELTASDPQMQFVCERFELELEELKDQQRMAVNDVPYNTIITFSPMTMELAGKPHLLKKGYQRPDIVRSMVRLSFWDGKRMHLLTRSLDHSSLSLLKSAAREVLGYDFVANTSHAMLGERIHSTMTLEGAREVLDKICASFDSKLQLETGIESHQGAFPPQDVDLLAFVESHPNILANVKREAAAFAPECRTYEEFESRLSACLYRHLALYDELLHGKDITVKGESISVSADGAGARAAESGTEYSLCGYVIAGQAGTALSAQTGFESLLSSSISVAQRIEITNQISKDKRSGECLSCAAKGTVFGCGLCARCNKAWCDEFRATGKGLEIGSLAKRFYIDRKKNIDKKRRDEVKALRQQRESKRFWN